MSFKPERRLTGGRVNYYLSRVGHPQREDQIPYTAECEDLIESLKLTPDEANVFKAIWRSANARLNNGKPDHKSVYDGEKMVHYSGRILKQRERADALSNAIGTKEPDLLEVKDPWEVEKLTSYLEQLRLMSPSDVLTVTVPGRDFNKKT